MALAAVPASGLWIEFRQVQKVYAIVGAMCIPLLAVVLLMLCGRSKLVGTKYRNSVAVNLLLMGATAFFLIAGWFEIQKRFFPV